MSASTIAKDVVDKLVASPNVAITQYDQGIAERIVQKEVEPVLKHLTNNEPWYRSRVTLGSVAAIAGGIWALYLEWAGGTLDMADLYTQGPVIAGGLTALYGRWVASRPIGA